MTRTQPTGYLPPGWPEEISPPGVDDWERQAVAYLLDCCPPDFRGHSVLRRYPGVLAVFAGHSVRGQQRAAMDGLAAVRTEVGGQAAPQVVDQAIDVWQQESARLVRVARSVDLVQRALAGERFVPKLGAGVT